MNLTDFVIMILFIFLGGLLIGTGITGSAVESKLREEALKANCGFYEPTTGEFKYGTPTR